MDEGGRSVAKCAAGEKEVLADSTAVVGAAKSTTGGEELFAVSTSSCASLAGCSQKSAH